MFCEYIEGCRRKRKRRLWLQRPISVNCLLNPIRMCQFASLSSYRVYMKQSSNFCDTASGRVTNTSHTSVLTEFDNLLYHVVRNCTLLVINAFKFLKCITTFVYVHENNSVIQICMFNFRVEIYLIVIINITSITLSAN